MRWHRAALGSLLMALFAAAVSPSAAADVTVFAAASLKGASNALAKQIESGAPADVFISADLDWMDYVDQRRLLAPDSRVNLLRNTLVLIAPSSSNATLKIGPNFALAAALGTEKLAMANPDSVPAGKYGKRALETMKVWTSVEKQAARTENVRAALALVSRGETPFGIVYRTDAMADKGVKVIDTFPSDSHAPIVYPAAITARSKSTAAQAFLDYLRSVPARAVWQHYGFGLAR